MIPFAKLHACGNDFLIIDSKFESRDLAIRSCARTKGIGADGVEFLEWTDERSGRIRLYNADGSIAEISGNGTRCVAAWVAHIKGLRSGETVVLDTDAGPRNCRIISVEGRRFQIATGMGVPVISNATVKIEDGSAFSGVVVSTGNPHFVLFVDDESFRVQGREWKDVGAEICAHSRFPNQTNVEFVLVRGPEEIEIRIFERGVGPTESSGTGTCASAVAAIKTRGLIDRLRVLAPGGEQRVEWDGAGEITLAGPAELIAQGGVFA